MLTFYGGMPADEHREGHHQPHGALDRPGQRHDAAGVAVDRRRQHRPQLLPGRRRSQRRPDAGQLAGARRRSPTCRRARCRRSSCRSTRRARRRSASSRSTATTRRNNESVLYDVGRYEVRNMIMAHPGAVAPVVYGGKIRAVLAYLDREQAAGPRASRRST